MISFHVSRDRFRDHASPRKFLARTTRCTTNNARATFEKATGRNQLKMSKMTDELRMGLGPLNRKSAATTHCYATTKDRRESPLSAIATARAFACHSPSIIGPREVSSKLCGRCSTVASPFLQRHLRNGDFFSAASQFAQHEWSKHREGLHGNFCVGIS